MSLSDHGNKLRTRLRQHPLISYGAVTAGLIAICLIGLALFGGRSERTGMSILPQDTGTQKRENPLRDKNLYVDPDSNASRQATAWRATAPDKATLMDKPSDQPSSRWFSNTVTYDEVHDYVQAANDAGQLPVTVAYYIPERDCNKYSTGGAANDQDYYAYINTYADAIGTLEAVVILEPDALVHMQSQQPDGSPCLDSKGQELYATLLTYAVERFKSLPATTVYINAGNSGWKTDTDTMASLLKRTGIDQADGFSLNVSNFRTNGETQILGDAFSKKVDGKHYVIDTSRNGRGPFTNTVVTTHNWCNPPGRAMGHYPTTDTGVDTVDAFLCIKNIGESDGADPDPAKCFNGPRAGQWWPDYAAGLVER